MHACTHVRTHAFWGVSCDLTNVVELLAASADAALAAGTVAWWDPRCTRRMPLRVLGVLRCFAYRHGPGGFM